MRIKACKKCGSVDIKIYDCGYSTFNNGGGECRSCGHKSSLSSLGCCPSMDSLIGIWNNGQKPSYAEKLKQERRKCSKLRKQLRGLGVEPIT